jgi:single-strand DNA-binding protein
LKGEINMNKVILMGRLTRDPEVRVTPSNIKVAGFTIAVDRKYKKQGEAETDFFNCTAFGKQADFVEKYLKQGTKMIVTGRVQNESYTNKEGQKVYSTKIMVDEMEFAESKSSAQVTQPTQQPVQQPMQNQGFMNIPTGMVDELPFA